MIYKIFQIESGSLIAYVFSIDESILSSSIFFPYLSFEIEAPTPVAFFIKIINKKL